MCLQPKQLIGVRKEKKAMMAIALKEGRQYSFLPPFILTLFRDVELCKQMS